jgi:hypothetical protein
VGLLVRRYAAREQDVPEPVGVRWRNRRAYAAVDHWDVLPKRGNARHKQNRN